MYTIIRFMTCEVRYVRQMLVLSLISPGCVCFFSAYMKSCGYSVALSGDVYCSVRPSASSPARPATRDVVCAVGSCRPCGRRRPNVTALVLVCMVARCCKFYFSVFNYAETFTPCSIGSSLRADKEFCLYWQDNINMFLCIMILKLRLPCQ